MLCDTIDVGLLSGPEITHMLTEAASKMAVLAAWRLLAEDVRRRAKELQVNAHRCARIAESTVGLELAEELEALASSFKREAHVLASSMQAAAYQLRLPWVGLP
jgi:hypothetical protein